jgi:cytoskeletal protein RodZ
MSRQERARYRSGRGCFSAAGISLVAILLGTPALLALGNASSAKPTAPAVSVPKESPKCAPTENAPSKDLPTSSTAPSQANTQSSAESQAQDATQSDTLKLESVQKDGVETSDPECVPGQNPDDPHCQASKAAKDGALQCVRAPAQKPDLAIDPEPAK